MQQRQPRLGDILDDYCPRERRLTNHAVVAMIGDAVKQTRCTTCDAEHEFKHAKVPRPRRKDEAAPGAVGAPLVPRRVVTDPVPEIADEELPAGVAAADAVSVAPSELGERADAIDETVIDDTAIDTDDLGDDDDDRGNRPEEGPVHRRLIRAQLPKIDGQPTAVRQAPDFTIRQPTGGARPGRFRGRPPQPQQRGGGGPMFGNRPGSSGNGNGNTARDPRGGQRPQGGGRPPMGARANKHHGAGRKRSK
jgi:hypothetical protein